MNSAPRGIDESIIVEALSDIDPDDEREIAAGLVARKLTPSVVERVAADRAEREKTLRRLVGFLVRRGYSQSLAFDVVGRRSAPWTAPEASPPPWSMHRQGMFPPRQGMFPPRQGMFSDAASSVFSGSAGAVDVRPPCRRRRST